jgi:hypothetical protein
MSLPGIARHIGLFQEILGPGLLGASFEAWSPAGGVLECWSIGVLIDLAVEQVHRI